MNKKKDNSLNPFATSKQKNANGSENAKSSKSNFLQHKSKKAQATSAKTPPSKFEIEFRDTLEDQKKQTNQENATLHDIEALKQNVATNTENLSALQSQVSQNCQSLEDLSTSLSAVETKNAQQDAALSSVEEKSKQQDAAISSLQTQIDEHDDTLTSMQTKNAEQDDALSSLEEKIAQQNTAISSMEEKNAQQDKTLSSLQTQIDEHGDAISSVEEKNTQQDNAISSMQTKITEHDNTLTSLETKNAQQDAALEKKADLSNLAAVAISGSYEDLLDKPTIPSALSELKADSTHQLTTDAEKSLWNSKYDKPAAGIPETDLCASAQTSLASANTALQSVTASNGVAATKSSTQVEIVGVAASANMVGVAKLHNAEACSSYSLDDVGITPNAVKQAITSETHSTGTNFADEFNATTTHRGTMSKEDKQKIDKAVTYTQQANVNVAGTSKSVCKYDQTPIFAENGFIAGGDAQNAGISTASICGVTEPNTENGACNKSNLYVNFDNTNSYAAGRQLVLQADSEGTHYGNNLYQYCAARGDAVKGYCDANYAVKTSEERIFELENNLNTLLNTTIPALQEQINNSSSGGGSGGGGADLDWVCIYDSTGVEGEDYGIGAFLPTTNDNVKNSLDDIFKYKYLKFISRIQARQFTHIYDISAVTKYKSGTSPYSSYLTVIDLSPTANALINTLVDITYDADLDKHYLSMRQLKRITFDSGRSPVVENTIDPMYGIVRIYGVLK